jgi:RNA polymerase sigma factor (sigma-70 family)
VDARSAEVVKLRYFGGLSIAQTAEALGVSERTVKREWSFARAWLRRELGEAGDHRGE